MAKTEVENRGIDNGVFETICRIHDDQPCYHTMGIKLTYLGPGVAGMKKDPDLKFSTHGGRAQGGVLATLADVVMGTAAFTNGYVHRTVEMSLNYLAPAFEDSTITAEGCVIHSGKTVVVVEASLFDKDGKLIAKSKGTFIRDSKTPNLQDVDDVGDSLATS